MGDHQTSWSLV